MLERDIPAGDLDEVTELRASILDLRAQLWQARDATQGALATAGSYKARNAELEMLVAQLRAEIHRLDQALKRRPGGVQFQLRRIARFIRRKLA